MLACKVLGNRNLDFFKNLFCVCAIVIVVLSISRIDFFLIYVPVHHCALHKLVFNKGYKMGEAGVPAVISDSGVR